MIYLWMFLAGILLFCVLNRLIGFSRACSPIAPIACAAVFSFTHLDIFPIIPYVIVGAGYFFACDVTDRVLEVRFWMGE